MDCVDTLARAKEVKSQLADSSARNSDAMVGLVAITIVASALPTKTAVKRRQLIAIDCNGGSPVAAS
jgi:hypothetical protein